MPILKIEKLTKKYGKTYALNGLNREVKEGDILAEIETFLVSPALAHVVNILAIFPNSFLTTPAVVANDFLAVVVDGNANVSFDCTQATYSENVAKTFANIGKLIPQVFPLATCGDKSTTALRLSAADTKKIVDSGVSTWVIAHSKNPSADGKIFYDQFVAVSPVAPANVTTTNTPAAAPITAPVGG